MGHLWEVDLAEKETAELRVVQEELRTFVVTEEGHQTDHEMEEVAAKTPPRTPPSCCLKVMVKRLKLCDSEVGGKTLVWSFG